MNSTYSPDELSYLVTERAERNEEPEGLRPQDFLEYQVAYRMFPIQTIIFVVLGTVGNLVSLVGFSTRELCRSSSSVYLRCLAVFDTCTLWSYLLYMVQRVYQPGLVGPVYCKLISFVTVTMSSLSGWTLTCMTVERYIAIRWPLLACWQLSQPKAVKTMIVMCALTLGFNLHFFWSTGEVYRKASQLALCGVIPTHRAFHRVWSYVESVCTIFVPLATVLVINCLIIAHIYASRKKCLSVSGDTQVTAGATRKTGSRNPECQSQQITVMLVSVSTAYLILVTPSAVSYVMLSYRYFDISDSRQYAQAFLFQQVCIMLLMCNHSINGAMYAFTGRFFRQELRSLLCGRRPGERRAASRTTSSRLPSMHSMRGRHRNETNFTETNN